MARQTYPDETSRLARLLDRRIAELSPKKSQRDIAIEAGFVNVNFLSMLKNGAAKLALDRVPAMARALEVDARVLFRAALEQRGFETQLAAIEEIFGTIVTEHEVAWLKEIRDASGNSDPRLTSRARSALRAIFGK